MEIDINTILDALKRPELQEYFNSYVRSNSFNYDSMQMAYNDSVKLYGIISQYITLKNDSVSIEIGCGFGWILARFSKVSRMRVGVDINFNAALTAKKAIEGKINNHYFINASADHLPFKENTADLIYSTAVLEHVTNIEEGVCEIHRVLKHGGKTFNVCQNIYWYYEPHLRSYLLAFLPKKIYRLILSAQNKHNEIKLLDSLVIFGQGYIFKMMRNIGYVNIKNIFIDHIQKKFTNPELVNNSTLKKMIKILNFFKISNFIISLWKIFYIADIMFLYAEKKEMSK